MLTRTRFLFITQRGAGKTRTRGNPIGEYGFIDVQRAPVVPEHVKEQFRLEKQKHIKTDLVRERKYVLCSKCGLSSVIINFSQVPSARIGMYGVCADGKDYTHHKFSVISQDTYRRLQPMSQQERVRWFFQR